MEELTAVFGGDECTSITLEALEKAKRWTRNSLKPWARKQREGRVSRRKMDAGRTGVRALS